LRSRGVEVTAHVLRGDPAEAIAEFAKSNGADLIVIGSRGLGAVSSALYGAVSMSLIRRSDIPVTVINHHAAERV
jgi:nucleotide-binding universal stress UspA family protein